MLQKNVLVPVEHKRSKKKSRHQGRDRKEDRVEGEKAWRNAV